MDKQTILAAAMRLAEAHGYKGVLKRHIAARLKCGMGTVNYHHNTMAELRREIVHEAIRTGNVRLITQARAWNDPVIWRKNLSASLRASLDALDSFDA